MNSSNKEKAVKGVYWMGIMSGSSIIIKLIITMVLSRMLSPHEFGLVASVQVVISFADLFWMMGVGPAIVQRKSISEKDVYTGHTLNIIFGVSVYCTIFIAAPLITKIVGIDNIIMLRLLSLVFLIHSISGVSEALLQKQMEFKPISVINITSLFIYGVIAILLAILGFGAWSLVFAQLVQVLVSTCLFIIKKPIGFKISIDIQSAKSLMFYGTGHTLARIMNNLARQGDYIVVNRTLGSASLGFYNRAYQLLLIPTNLIATIMDKVLFPLLSKYQDNNDKVKFVYFNLTALIALLAFPITIISVLMGADLVSVILGPNWNATVVPFKILVISLFFRMGYKICDSLVRSLGAVYKRLWVQIMYATLVIVGALIGKEWGINGVAVATSIAIFANYLVMTILIKRLVKLEIRELLSYLTPIIFISLLIGAISYFISIMLIGFSYALVRLIIMTLAVGILYSVALKFFLLSTMPKGFRNFLGAIIGATTEKILPEKYRKQIANSLN